MPEIEGVRIETCPKCGKGGLVYQSVADMSRSMMVQQLTEPSGMMHKCSSVVPQPVPATVIRPELTDSQMETLLNGVMSTITLIANSASSQMAKRLAEELAKIGPTITAELQARIPVQHEILVSPLVGQGKTITGRPHKSLETMVSVIAQRIHLMLVGPAGSGKTTAAQQAAVVLGLPYYEASMGPATSQWDLMGYRSPDGKYVEGILRKPYQTGGVMMLDEMDNSHPSVLTALNSALSNGGATFPDGRVERHPDFICVAGANTYGRGADRLYVGRTQLDAATLDRFAVLAWDFDEEAELDWTGRDQLAWARRVQMVRAVVQKHAMRVVVSPRASIFGARLLRAGMPQSVVEELELWKGMGKDDRAKVEAELRPQPTSRNITETETSGGYDRRQEADVSDGRPWR